ncbi:MAG TPA: helix-turn-helix domain-containing protein [Candidatus Polarisedimenticolia bacterium]|nr:helix-turn-helix domain-containing protein [Candidatus Polarisedimenticolia bacterium]
MSRGRPPDGVGHVDRLEGPDELKRRLKVLLATLDGSKSVPEACAELQVSESRLHELRREALEGALRALQPRPSGRPSKPEAATPRERELEAHIATLEEDLQAAYVRTELALAMPHLFKGKKNLRIRKSRPLPGASGGGDGT